jgi:N,N-dimethylformamidase
MKSVILGYCDRDSGRPGDRIMFKVSCEGAERFRADFVRLGCCETPPEGPGFREAVVATPAAGDYPARRQSHSIGSCVVAPGLAGLGGCESFTLQALVWPTKPAGRAQAIIGAWNESQGAGIYLGLDERGALSCRIGDGKSSISRSTDVPLRARHWYLVAVSLDAPTGALRLYHEHIDGGGEPEDEGVIAEFDLPVRPNGPSARFIMAAWDAGSEGGSLRTGGHFDGKIDRPRLSRHALTLEAIRSLVLGPAAPGVQDTLLAAWDFSADIETDRVHDASANALHGEAINLPTRGVTGFNWSGTVWHWPDARHEYGAIHFHADDLYDAGWETDIALTIPEDWRSGIYAARLRAGDSEFHVPFSVRPPRGKRTADTLFLVPTATYMAYANNFGRVVSPVTDALIGKLTLVDDIDLLMLNHRELGLSTYDAHLDGSPVHYSSRMRPVTNHRPRESDIAMAYNNFAADLLIVDWLDRIATDFDVLTDEDLHWEGGQALEGYRVIVTGTHPEYTSLEMLNALERFTRQGGRLMYMGGNGFYWRVAFRADRPGVIELRRAQTLPSRWNPGPGQYFHSFTGEHGGLWRDLGRAPQMLAGVGFISQGFDSSAPYRRQADAGDPRVAFIFDGVEEDVLGDFGLMRGGAAGVEIDRTDDRRGTPAHTLVVASSSGHTNIYEAFEETVAIGAPVGEARSAIRADMVFFECPNGGAVFSTGSIAYAGSLSHNGYDNPIAKLTGNVLRRFLDPRPFAFPAAARDSNGRPKD